MAKSKKTKKTTTAPRPSGPAKLTGGFKQFIASLRFLVRHGKLFGGILLVFAVLVIVLVKGFAGGANLSEIRNFIENNTEGGANQFSLGLTLFNFLAGSASNPTTEGGSVYQWILTVIVSLAFIWALRQVVANKPATVRTAYYQGMQPLVPFVLVLIVIILQLLPALAGAAIFSLIASSALAVTIIEKLFWGLILLSLILLSLYMISSSIFALYIVALPGMTPLRALRSARKLVIYRRSVIIRRLIVLPLALILLSALVMLPLILYAMPIAEWAFFALSVLIIGITHTYIYRLYRELLP